ncbi:MAG TPA: SufD family Fe-S cluster assembly protein [Candidatus Paceibacterota bacterium]|nr:SufD family Fe-S cluster assembly protein [Candidatus Paceibacterota bacterium]
MLKITDIFLNLNSVKANKPAVFKIPANSQLNLTVTGSFKEPKTYEYTLPILLGGVGSAVNVEGKFFVCGGSHLNLIFTAKDTAKAKAASINLNLKGLVFDKSSHIFVKQKISLSHKDSHLKHSLAFGSLSKEVLNYLDSRGVDSHWLRSYLEENYVKVNA